ncbi:flagellar basal body P-ring biosynthesis protein FlgA [Rhodobacteraceae bacterium THAF1]|uniref:flagellar basal body P-ring formation chaperone FlgA n=1 Tax=Palleronia sp. THAF1 TaxID=2587842 RepID=UPI000F3AFEE1|nr:flagellar basal body P-ring formation chaperone FlgA [Palleronia sp. THAF1]QFU10285.1 flagellar basal body P-ring biosynthesis protein FlgA [Palleronia sp. THAF1]VDC16810.1 flagellar basal body P-ring biosynthesis protein FlgA [Rhodobacteraceae bacterium THAF1]
MIRIALLLILTAAPALADMVVATTTIRARSLIGPGDLKIAPGGAPGLLSDPSAAIGQEARVTLYAGRPVRTGDIGPPALIERNQIVVIEYAAGTLRMRADGRALDRAGVGDRLRVMNLSSRATVFGDVMPDGTVTVSQGFR